MERTLSGIMKDAGVARSDLAEALHISLSALRRKLVSNNFKSNEIRQICQYFHITDPSLIVEVFALVPSQ